MTEDDRATLAGLRHASDDRPGISRRRAGRGFTYRDASGRLIRDAATLDRIRSIVIPPAWTDVWICPWPNGHLQATGRDARGRKQYRYHPRYRARRDGVKFERLIAFARALPAIRAQVERDLSRPGLPQEKVVAAVVRLLELTLIRVGNDEYARLNRSFGLTTLRDRHAEVDGAAITFRFRAKSGQQREVGLRDRRLAGLVKRCQDLPGQELFQYIGDDGEPHDIASDHVNDYLAAIAPGITAKGFRTWAGTVLAYRALRATGEGSTDREKQKNVAAAIQATADGLGNTAAVARQAYVHPAVVDAYLDGRIRRALVAAAEDADQAPGATNPDEEKAVIALLRARLREDAVRTPTRAPSPRRSPARRRPATRPATRVRGSSR
ncbi:MAG: DNA topoisomerase IB [Chloroflexi bacterium]|nr:DNA topoisomerase IB [Chloroflexota bacterium]